MVFGGSMATWNNNTENNETYLYNGDYYYWTMSPFAFNFANAGVGYGRQGAINRDSVGDANNGVRPVISLLASGITDGNGTASMPFIIGSE